ncbi:MAG: DNA-directed RNA polymerase subunit omega [Rickettsiales bacterium]
MARVTVEDCITKIPNRFDLVLLASQRAKQITSGNPPTVERDNDKDSVISLREIAEETIDLNTISDDLMQSFFKRPISDIADQKLLTKGEDIPSDVEEAFRDAASSVRMSEDSIQSESGMSFDDDNIDADD